MAKILAYDEAAIALAKEIVDVDSVFGKNSPIAKRYYASFSQIPSKEGENLPQKFLTKLEGMNKKIKEQRDALRKIARARRIFGNFSRTRTCCFQ